MATTYFKAVHRTNSGSISAALKNTINYAENPDKTNGGVLVYGYECNPHMAAAEFMLTKVQYEQMTGRDQGKNDVVGYQIRQSFAPNEVTPEQALEIGRELAYRFTKGQHQYIVAVHTNTAIVHSHIFFNSVTLDCSRKYKDFKHSALALRKISDRLCLENGLSIIEKPGLSKGRDYAEYMADRKPPSAREQLCDLIDANLVVGQSFGEFLAKLKRAGCEVKFGGKHTAVKIPGGKKNIRFDSLPDDYTEAAIKERLRGVRDVAPRKVAEPNGNRQADERNDAGAQRKAADYAAAVRSSAAPKLLIDIEAKIRAGYGARFVHNAKLQNLKDAAKTLIFLKEQGINTYEQLVDKESDVSDDYFKRNERRKVIDKRLADITELQKRIGSYGKTRAVYSEYKAIKNPKKAQEFYEAHRADIAICQAAKKYFDEQHLPSKLPSINMLKDEYAKLLVERKALGNIKAARESMIDWARAKHNVDIILGEPPAPTPKKILDRGAL